MRYKDLSADEKIGKFTHAQLGALLLMSRWANKDGMTIEAIQDRLDMTADEFGGLIQGLYDVGAVQFVSNDSTGRNDVAIDFDFIEISARSKQNTKKLSKKG